MPMAMRYAPEFNLDEHLFYMLAKHFFERTRQGSFTRKQIVDRLEKVQDEVLKRKNDPNRAT